MNSAMRSPGDTTCREMRLPQACSPFLRKLFAKHVPHRWLLSFAAFESALARSAAKRFPGASLTTAQLEDYCANLHLEDLALACACAEGLAPAWEEFVPAYRAYLRSAAAAIIRCSASDPAALDLADSLFSDLYGLPVNSAQQPRRSLLDYFHGRSSLKTWLRAVLAQRHIDQIRAARKFDSLDGQPADGETRRFAEPATLPAPTDPRREHYLLLFREALANALAELDARDRSRLQLYYAEERTLAEIGRKIGEHESSVSRHLERIRKELRTAVEGLLRAGRTGVNGSSSAGLDDAQLALCLQYAAEEAPIDLDQLLQPKVTRDLPGRHREVKP